MYHPASNLSSAARRLHNLLTVARRLCMIAGMTTTAQYVFDLDGGQPCLDFANTLTFSGEEHLNTYADLVAFAGQSLLITPEDAEWLRAEAQRDTATVEGVLVRARRLRTSIYAIF